MKGARNAKGKRSSEIVENLDLDIDDYFNDGLNAAYDNNEDEKILFNKRKGRSTPVVSRDEDDDAEDGSLSESEGVLPTDAHAAVTDADGAVEGKLALQESRQARKSLQDSDFAIDGSVLPPSSSFQSQQQINRPSLKTASEVSNMVELVQRDYASLSNAERRSVLEKESPELLKLLEEYHGSMEEVSKLAEPLRASKINRKKPANSKDANLLVFLEAKVQLLLSYCMHVSVYLLLKCEGKPVTSHPIVERLVELRTYMEKLGPIEQKLQYSISKMSTSSAETSSDAIPASQIRAVEFGNEGVYRRAGNRQQDEERRQRRNAERELRDEEEVNRAEEEAMTRIQRKKGKSFDSDFVSHLRDDGYQEAEDQFFSRIADRKSGSLAENLQQARKDAKNDDEDNEDDVENEGVSIDEDDYGDDDKDEAYNTLVEENKALSRKRAREEEERNAHLEDDEEETPSVRRSIDKRIASHRGLTKARPKDRKTPRTGQRRKYAKGLIKASSLTKSYTPEPEGGFTGVKNFRPNVTHGTNL